MFDGVVGAVDFDVALPLTGVAAVLGTLDGIVVRPDLAILAPSRSSDQRRPSDSDAIDEYQVVD